VRGEELQAKEVCPSARTPRDIYAIACKKARGVLSF